MTNSGDTFDTSPKNSLWSPAAVLSLIASRWRQIGGISLLGAALTACALLVPPRIYSSSSSFTPQGSKQAGQFSMLAAQFGATLPGSDPTSSPQFYVDLLRSRTILRALVDSLRVPVNGTAESLVEVLDVRAASPKLAREITVDRLISSIAVTTQQRTGVVTITVRAKTPELARQVNAALLNSINSFNMNRRKSQAGAERNFAERRLIDVKKELSLSEMRLRTFLQDNRQYTGSAQLQFEYDRLAADLALQRSVETTLAQLAEQARLDEVRDTPVITVVEPPTAPVRPDSRRLVSNTTFAFIATALIWTVMLLGTEYIRSESGLSKPTSER